MFTPKLPDYYVEDSFGRLLCKDRETAINIFETLSGTKTVKVFAYDSQGRRVIIRGSR